MRKLLTILFALVLSGHFASAATADGEDLIRKATAVIDETVQHYAAKECEKKVSVSTILPDPDKQNVIITFTIDELNRIHVVEIQGGYAYLTHYIKSSLEGQTIKSEHAIPGINYMMAIKLPASA
ncbi:MAG TPA: hypothetical protein PKC38_02890 [Chitinophagales bacterium]|nr:hypothetical protein [Chitinophagales bacterium]HMU68926.1 hypothetical protein [Chitinophagales bacterium]HMX05677.1 hypothetical protein [Chitinophagales bacterium]HNJ88112.1 hypothetical protein [Chitinophagales bacterium]